MRLRRKVFRKVGHLLPSLTIFNNSDELAELAENLERRECLKFFLGFVFLIDVGIYCNLYSLFIVISELVREDQVQIAQDRPI